MIITPKTRLRPGETQKIIKIEIIDDDVFEQDEIFFVRLEEVDDEGSGQREKGRPLSASKIKGILQCEVAILNDDDLKTFADKVTAMLSFNTHKFALGR